MTLALVIAGALDHYLALGWLIEGIAVAFFFIPLLAVGARRLHDTDRGGWWQLLLLFPIIGAIMLMINYAMPSTHLVNDHGPPPKI